MSRARPFAFNNARLVDPETGYDGPGAVVVSGGVIADIARGRDFTDLSSDVRVIDCNGGMLAPGLVDLRVKTGEPGSETKETLRSAAQAAAAGGVTSIVVQPDTDPAVDDPSVVDFILRRAQDIESCHIHAAGAATKGLRGEQMAEIGLMREAGARYITDVDRPIIDSKVMRRILSYAAAFGMALAHRPQDPWLSKGAAATEGEFASRMGLPSAPAASERIGLERDLALAELSGGRLLVDQITCAAALEALARAKARGVNAVATASINHLSFNELDIGDYRTFYRLDPPLRPEDDRQALIEALASGRSTSLSRPTTPRPPRTNAYPSPRPRPARSGCRPSCRHCCRCITKSARPWSI